VKLVQAIKKGVFGKILIGNAYIKWYRNSEYYTNSPWRGTLEGDGGAVLINQGIHTIDLLINILGLPIKVFAKTRTMVHKIEGEDVGIAMLEFDSGALGTIEGSTATYPGIPERLEIFGEKGGVILEGGQIIHWETLAHTIENKKTSIEPISGASDPTAIGFKFHERQIEDMIEAIWNDRTPVIDGNEGLKSLILLDAIYKSSREGIEV
jgi:predicted dehydrogenase